MHCAWRISEKRSYCPTRKQGRLSPASTEVARNRNDEGGLCPDTAIQVQLHRDGARYRLRWRQDGQGYAVEEWDAATGCFQASASQAVIQRFPLRLFSQGQIAALAGDSQQALLQVIDDAAGAQTQRSAFEEAKRAFLASRARMRELEGKLQARDALTLSLQDVQRKLARFEQTNHAAVLKNYQRTSRQSRELEHQFAAAAELVARLTGMCRGTVGRRSAGRLVRRHRRQPGIGACDGIAHSHPSGKAGA